ncbi:hypothetical protein K402DRAFT_388874 [Aulographum hederae CBS 113979]|uniref:MARVEL domain-containing protein n=1 Tax=Aulographum hederae CBS 113979 TaxID=1176131 RepID=A0A6G1HE84_9PEZI|nr:hypothetical protein K402DRAFT_388874 [Aulographum hederae CBS 113979]
MGKLAGGALRLFQTALYALTFCCAAIILGIYSYFLAILADHDRRIPTWEKAVEGLSGVAVVYLIFAVVMTCCLGGVTFFAFLAIVFDVLLCGAMIAIAVMTRDGADSCSGFVETPIGNGLSNSNSLEGFGENGFGTGDGENVTYASSLGTACTLNKVCFAVSIIGAFLFLVCALVQIFLGRHHQKEKRYGPSPANGYTAGSGGKFWQRKRGPKTTNDAYAKDAEVGVAGSHLAPGHDNTVRPSHDTAYTGSTMASPTNGTYTGNKYEPTPAMPAAGGYHTAPQGSGVNPYGYDNTRPTANNF